MKVDLKTWNIPDEIINKIQTEKKLEEIISTIYDENETTMQEQNNNVQYIAQVNPFDDANDHANMKFNEQLMEYKWKCMLQVRIIELRPMELISIYMIMK